MMTPKERLLAAMRRQETDYLPCAPNFWASPSADGYRWRNEKERLEVVTRKLGLDACLWVDIQTACHPDVKVRTWQDNPAGEPFPVLHKAFDTPGGILEAAVRVTEDWPHGADVPLISDFNVSRYIKPWLQTSGDVENLRFILQPPGREEILRFRETLKNVRVLAEEFQVPVAAVYTLGLTTALHFFGAEKAVLLSVDEPEIISRYLEIQRLADDRILDILLDTKEVDFVRRDGFYESTDFWSPAQFEKWILPWFTKEVALAHQSGRPVTYQLCTGIMPLLPLLSRIEFDCLDTIEPALGHQDMPEITRCLGERKSFWTGLSGPEHLCRGNESSVRAAVRTAVETWGRKGFILGAVPSIRPQWPWENVLAMFDEWRKIR